MRGTKIGFIGGGNMATSLIAGLIGNGHDANDLLVAEPDEAKRDQLAAQHGVITLADNAAVAAQVQALVVAVKPQVMNAALASIAGPVGIGKPLIISIAAGVPLARLRAELGASIPLVRAMPNTPALVRCGITGAVQSDPADTDNRRLATALLGAVGEVRWFSDETDLDRVTAVSGSGPAYFFFLMEAMQQAAEQIGLPADTARDLVLHTALGAAKLALHDPADPATLRARVTSPGGTTAAAITVLENGKLPDLIHQALDAAFRRARELAA